MTTEQIISLRPYQQKAIDDIKLSIMAGNKRVMLQMPTGSGKSRTAAAIIQGALNKGKKVLFIADLKTLVNQSSIEFAKLGIDGSVVMADDGRYAPWKNLHICSAQTLMRRKVPDADLVIVDEAHTHYSYLTDLMSTWSLVPFIGLSATPFTRGLGKYYQDLVLGPTVRELTEGGFLVDVICYGPETIDLTGIKMTAGDYNPKQLAERVERPKITADIVKTYLDYGDGRKTILFPVNVAHSKMLVNAFNDAGIIFNHIDAHTKQEDREESYRRLKAGEITGLSSVGVLSKGFDETSVSCVILAFATKSLMKYIQTIGRGLRSHEGKTDCIVLDHGGNVARHGFPDDELPAFLCDGEKTEAASQKEIDKEKEEKELLPKTCPKCDRAVKPDIFTCPCCGYIFAKKSDVEVEAGKLEKLAKKETSAAGKRNRLMTKDQKQGFYSAALSHCKTKGFKEGWASNKYREYFGVWPNAMDKSSGGHSAEFSSFLTASNIRYANRRK